MDVGGVLTSELLSPCYTTSSHIKHIMFPLYTAIEHVFTGFYATQLPLGTSAINGAQVQYKTQKKRATWPHTVDTFCIFIAHLTFYSVLIRTTRLYAALPRARKAAALPRGPRQAAGLGSQGGFATTHGRGHVRDEYN